MLTCYRALRSVDTNSWTQGYFFLWNAVPEILSQQDASRNCVPEPIFPLIGLNNTNPLRPNSGPLFGFRNFFLRNISQVRPI